MFPRLWRKCAQTWWAGFSPHSYCERSVLLSVQVESWFLSVVVFDWIQRLEAAQCLKLLLKTCFFKHTVVFTADFS